MGVPVKVLLYCIIRAGFMHKLSKPHIRRVRGPSALIVKKKHKFQVLQ